MKKVLDKLLDNIKFDKKYVFFAIIIILIGIITGSLFIVLLNNSDKSLVIEYIESFINNNKISNINYLEILKNTLIINYGIILVMIILGFSCIFSPINILILFYKAFVIGFSISSFILTYKFKGILLSFSYIFPHLIINILLFSLLTAFTLKMSSIMVKYIINKKEVNMRHYFNKFIYIITFSSIIIGLSSLYEIYIFTKIFRITCNLI